MKIGVLALQGDFKEHITILNKLGAEAVPVRTKQQLDEVKGLILPGGESTTMGKLLKKYSLDKAIKERYQKGMALYGTCAGAVLLAKEIIDFPEQKKLGLIDISILRNAYGRQINSFEADIKIKGFKKPFHSIFIRAPMIKKIRNRVEILAKHNKEPVLLKKDNILISTFHPELTEDTRIHKYFLKMIKDKSN